MGVKTGIPWTNHTFSQWIGCSPVHAGCDNCYAAAMAGRLGVTWGPNGTRRRTARSTWLQVERWNRRAECNCYGRNEAGGPHLFGCPQKHRPRVFMSLCDPFEDWLGPVFDSSGNAIRRCADCGVLVYWPDLVCGCGSRTQPWLTMGDCRRDFFALIDRCPNLDFLLATKRPQNVLRMWPCSEAVGKRCPACGSNEGVHGGCRCGLLKALWGKEQTHRRNVWLLYSASDQQTLDAGLPHLLACRDLVPVLGLSLEPLLGQIRLKLLRCDSCGELGEDGLRCPNCGRQTTASRPIDWVIVGGESGPRARPCNVEWFESLADQCQAAGVPLFVKQDSGPKPGLRGRLPDRLWDLKQFPAIAG